MADTLLKRRTRKLSLAFMGEGWEDCYIEVLRPNYHEGEQIDEISKTEMGIKGLVQAMKVLFVSGQGLDSTNQPIALQPDHLDSFDSDAIMEMTDQITNGEQPDPKVGKNSPSTTPAEVENPSILSDSNTGSDSASPPSN